MHGPKTDRTGLETNLPRWDSFGHPAAARCVRLRPIAGRRRLVRGAVCFILLAGMTAAAVGSEPLLELKTGDATFVGKSLGHNNKVCWLMSQDGRVDSVSLKRVTSFRQVSSEFKCYSAQEMRDHLQREFGNEFEVVATTHYLVCATRSQAAQYAKVFEEIYRGFHAYFSTRGFKITEPEFRLVAIVFPDHKAFGEYARKDGVTAAPGLVGYYHQTSNRTALFDSKTAALSLRERVPGPQTEAFSTDRLFRSIPDLRNLTFADGRTWCADQTWHGTIQADLKDTIVHEATHQVAFNTGLHSRIGDNPVWVLEGLATVFEAPGVRSRSNRYDVDSRINTERFLWFGDFVNRRRTQKSLAKFIASDTPFKTAVLDAYSQAWALTFFLLETRPSDYARYLKRIAEHNPLEPYTAKQRVNDFKNIFGDDVERLEVEFLRFISRLK